MRRNQGRHRARSVAIQVPPPQPYDPVDRRVASLLAMTLPSKRVMLSLTKSRRPAPPVAHRTRRGLASTAAQSGWRSTKGAMIARPERSDSPPTRPIAADDLRVCNPGVGHRKIAPPARVAGVGARQLADRQRVAKRLQRRGNPPAPKHVANLVNDTERSRRQPAAGVGARQASGSPESRETPSAPERSPAPQARRQPVVGHRSRAASPRCRGRRATRPRGSPDSRETPSAARQIPLRQARRQPLVGHDVAPPARVAGVGARQGLRESPESSRNAFSA